MKRLLIILTIGLVSCKQGVNFVIHNDSSDTIDVLKIKTSDFTSEISLNGLPHTQKKIIFLDMSETKGIDGHYNLSSLSNGVTKTVDFGYYTNGAPLEDTIDIYVNNLNVNFRLGRQ